MKFVKNWLKNKLRNALALPVLENDINQIRSTVYKDSQGLFGISNWYEGNLWEPPVQIALRDLCKPGDIVFDVGANFGGLTTTII